jgi:hypothetical protein
MILAEDIKARIDLREYVERDLGAPEQRHTEYAVWRCPFTGERTPSFTVHAGYFKCFGSCDHKGDVFSYVQLRMNCDFKDAVEILAKEVSLDAPIVVKKEAPKPRKILELKDMQGYELERARVLPYLCDQRKLNATTLEYNHIGGQLYERTYITLEGTPIRCQCNRVAMPYVFGDKVLCMNFRRDEKSVREFLDKQQPDIFEAIRYDLSQKRKCAMNEIRDEDVNMAMFCLRYQKLNGMQDAVYGVDQIARIDGGRVCYNIRGSVLLGEGELTALAAQSLGYTALACKASTNLDLARCFQNVRNIYIPVENDQRLDNKGQWEHPGMAHALRLYDRLGGKSRGVKIVRLPEEFKDLNDLLILGELSLFLAENCAGLEPKQ